MPRRNAALVLSILVSVSTAAASEDGGPAPDESAQVDADRMHVDHGRRTARFDGNVKVKYGRLRLKCSSMEVAYDDGGRLISLKAKGRVEVTRGEARASAGTARLDARQSLLVLEGEPVLVQGPHRLEGSRISVDLETGKIDVSKARGKFRIGLRKGR